MGESPALPETLYTHTHTQERADTSDTQAPAATAVQSILGSMLDELPTAQHFTIIVELVQLCHYSHAFNQWSVILSSAFHTDRRLSRVVIRISSMVAAHNSLWIGTENGIVMSFPFSSPTIVAEEAGWEVRDGSERWG